MLGEIFGEAGRHARSAVGVAVLPLDAPVEVELVVQVRGRPTRRTGLILDVVMPSHSLDVLSSLSPAVPVTLAELAEAAERAGMAGVGHAGHAPTSGQRGAVPRR